MKVAAKQRQMKLQLENKNEARPINEINKTSNELKGAKRNKT